MVDKRTLQQVQEDLTAIPKQKSSLPCYLEDPENVKSEYKIKLKSRNYKLANQRTSPNCQKSVMKYEQSV